MDAFKIALNLLLMEEWAEGAAALLKHKLREVEVTYADLTKRLKKHGFKPKLRPALPIS
jgi:hypothetical protein